jgi:outer membrane immunogenic protein
MKKTAIFAAAFAALVLAAPAQAADMPIKGPVYKAAPAVFDWTGLYIGGHIGWGTENGSDASGVIGGVQIGYNWQFNRNWVFGVEADISATDISENTIPARVDYLASVRARLGYTWDRTMIYGTGGWGTAQVTGAGVSVTGDAFTLGAGIEWAFAPRWSAKVEYMYYGFEDQGFGSANAQTVKFGVNYRFWSFMGR